MSPSSGKFAVVLNCNAKKVTSEVEEISAELVDPDDLYLSCSADEADEIARQLIDNRYDAVFAGGGDGTVMQLINSLSKYPIEKQPVIGILKLGTGNAMARMVSSGNLVGDLKTYMSSATRETSNLSLIEAEGHRFPFAGLGLDAEILNDYRSVKDSWGRTVLKPVLQSVGGYFFSYFMRTAPRRIKTVVARDIPRLRVVVKSGAAEQLGTDGQVEKTFKPGEVIYDGPFTIAMVGTVPYYGYGLKILPFATKDPGRMHLRITDIGQLHALTIFPSIWRGEQSASLKDYLAQDIEILTDRPVPFQMGGDAEGARECVRFKILPNAVRLLKLL